MLVDARAMHLAPAPHLLPYETSGALTTDRIRWARMMFVRHVAAARAAGSLDGESHIAPVDPTVLGSEIAHRSSATPSHPVTVPMLWMCEQLGLDDQDRDALWLLIAIEIDAAVARISQLFGSNDCPDMNLQLWRSLVPLHMSRVDALSELGLIELSSDRRLPHHRRAVRANDRLVEIATGEVRVDRDIGNIATLARTAVRDFETEVCELAASVRVANPSPYLFAIGPDGSGRSTLLHDVAAALGVNVLVIQAHRLARESLELARQLRVIARECALFGAIPLFEGLDEDPDHPITTMIDAGLEVFQGPVFCTARTATRSSNRPVIAHELKPLTVAQRVAVWKRALPGADASLLEEIGDRYVLRPGAIVASARNIRAVCTTVSNLDVAAVHAGVRAEIGERIGATATRVECSQTWDDLVLPVDQLDQVAELVARVRQRRRVLSEWGFADKIGKGFGIASLFSGPPGTGKTMVAGLIAKELGLDLYQVDLSKIVSKYIGETEKQLAALFDAAETGQAIILFDEADSLFAKRSEVKSSNDRYANLEVNYLLQRMEVFTGITILTTNHETSIDEAFRRRLAIQVRFPVPDETQREGLWRAMIPSRASVAPDIDFERLARDYAMSGGYVKNAVVRAAYIAADQDIAISMAHLWQAARAEYEAMGKVVRG